MAFFMFASPYAHQKLISRKTQSSLCSQRTGGYASGSFPVVTSFLWLGTLQLPEWPVQLSSGNGGGIEVLAQELPRSGVSILTECASLVREVSEGS